MPFTCASCGNRPETDHHVFVGCCNVEAVWEKASLWHIINTVRNTVDDMKSLIFHILKTCSPTQVEKFVAILCVLWRRRTEQMLPFSETQLVTSSDLKPASIKVFPPHKRQRPPHFLKPYLGLLKFISKTSFLKLTLKQMWMS
ncbi:hypothetical protein JHK82_017014 [Glycine max]|nr:hypothetical protein JHK85_017434 [Glycine max]KAG5047655.1 hypothetical protein JHK86_017061 [Glycine max]KAG5150133.1 hypothetical protein JHK82_017014 [Glycine max]